MKKYKKVFKSDKSKDENRRFSKPLILLNDLKLVDKVKNDFPDVEFTIEEINSGGLNSEILSNSEKPEFIVTDSKKFFKNTYDINIYLYKEVKVQKGDKLLIHTFEELPTKINKSSVSLFHEIPKCNDSIYSLIKKNWRKAEKIVKIENEKISVAIKVNGIWTVKDNFEIEQLFLLKKGLSIQSEVQEIKTNDLPLNTFSNIENNNIKYTDSYFNSEDYYEKLNWILSENLYPDILNLHNVKGCPFYKEHLFTLKTPELFNLFISKIENGQWLNGIEYTSYEKLSDDRYKFITKYGNVFLKRDGDFVVIVANMLSTLDNEAAINKFSNAILINFENHINNNVHAPRLGAKQLIQALGGFLVLVFLFVSTFVLIFDQSNILFIVDSFFSVGTWKTPWMYLIITSFMFSFFMPFFIAYFVEIFVLRKKKMEWKRASFYFLAGAIRNTATFLTGNYFLAMFLWGWYINRKLDIRVATLVGTISTMSVIKGVLLAFIGTIMMMFGTYSYFGVYSSSFDWTIIWVFIISWLGFAWELIHNFWVYLLILSPLTIRFILNTTLRFKHIKKDLNKDIIQGVYYQNELFNNSRIDLSWKNNSETIVRMSLIVFIPILIEGIESVYYFNYVDYMALYSCGLESMFHMYYDIFSIMSLRFVANQIHHFPIINILPGRGMFFSEYGLTTIYAAIFDKHHIGELTPDGNWHGFSTRDLSQMTAFTTRFFNVYLNNSLVIIIASVVLTKEIFIRKRSNIK